MQNLPPNPASPPPSDHVRRRQTTGMVLITIGVLTFIATIARTEIIGLLVLPALGMIFIAWGVVTKHFGFMIPGGILLGLGIGTLVQQEFMTQASSDTRGAVVVLGLALGFLAILPLCWFVAERLELWTLIPGGVLLVVGLCLLIGGTALNVLQFVGNYFWPLLLVGVGGYLLWRANHDFPRRHHHHTV